MSRGSMDSVKDVLLVLAGGFVAMILALAAMSIVYTGCSSRAGQATLRAGLCALDTGVLSTVLDDLRQPDYDKLVRDLIAKIVPDAVLCALDAAGTAPTSAGELSPTIVRARELRAKLGPMPVSSAP